MTITADMGVLGLIFTSLLQLLAASWWASRLTTRVESLESWRGRHEAVLEMLAEHARDLRNVDRLLARLDLSAVVSRSSDGMREGSPPTADN